ncbi:MAG: hydroxylamine reductase, partial [Vallitaleaceae bacterium]|nr:hydroxylamine reductase [Vallitaleaceae bacterium]
MSMFCYQCQEAAKGTGCTVAGVCGKTPEVANLQDLLIYSVKGIAEIVTKGNLDVESLGDINETVLDSLFKTITNANFDAEAIKKQIVRNLQIRDGLRSEVSLKLHDAATFSVSSDEEMEVKATEVGVLLTENEDVRSLRELIIYGLKGLAAYTHHALNLGKEDVSLYAFVYEALAATLNDQLSADELVALTMKTGEYGVKAMALLDAANTSSFGNPEITKVNIGVRNNPAILISGHDLNDLEMLLEQTKGTGVDVYTHSEMLPANYYPKFKQYENLVGNYG